MEQINTKAMVKASKILLFSIVAMLLAVACKEEELGASRIDTSTPDLSELDQWLRTTFTEPYNVEVLYKWTDYEGDLTKNLVPPSEDKVQPLMDVMDQVWIKCYEEEGGETFIKSYIPKLIYLLGGAGVNPEGTVVQGTAEAGRKIVLYEVNKFDPTDADRINRFFHVMHHEFAHILHQTELYPTDAFEAISSGDYRSDWSNVSSDSVALYMGLGFCSPYGMSSRDEDFVEFIAHMLTRTYDEWEEFITQEGSDEEKMRAKTAIVVEYFRDIWSIDIYDLQALIAERIQEVAGTSNKNYMHSEAPYTYTDDHAQFCSGCELVQE